ncbi:hypothetical protein ACIQF5_21105 [Streptomyces goshikiensis]|uniref:hypothetical protein n=1 Tax=Streptomyces goshikiensis TaxID=1942 RepID=UPI0038195972
MSPTSGRRPSPYVMRAAEPDDLDAVRALAEGHQTQTHSCGEFADVLEFVRVTPAGVAALDGAALWILADTEEQRVVAATVLNYHLVAEGLGVLVQCGQISDSSRSHDRLGALMSAWVLDLAGHHHSHVAEVRRVTNCVPAVREAQRAGWGSETVRLGDAVQEVLSHQPRPANSLTALVATDGVPGVLPPLRDGSYSVLALHGRDPEHSDAVRRFLTETSPDGTPTPGGFPDPRWNGRAVLRHGRLTAVATEQHLGPEGHVVGESPTTPGLSLYLADIRTRPPFADEAVHELGRWALHTADTRQLPVLIEAADLAASQTLRSAGLRLTRIRLRPDGPRYLLSSPAPKPGPAGPATGRTPHLEEAGSA